jgi:predicted PurR-regulated permease PerM
MDTLQSLPPVILLVLGLLLIVWLILFLLVPFMLESIRSWSRKTYHELTEMNKKLDRLTMLLDDRNDPRPQIRTPVDPRSDRVRKEPTLSDVAPIPADAKRRSP